MRPSPFNKASGECFDVSSPVPLLQVDEEEDDTATQDTSRRPRRAAAKKTVYVDRYNSKSLQYDC